MEWLVLTAWDFFEVDEFFVTSKRWASGEVRVKVAFLVWWVVISDKATRNSRAQVHAVLQSLELAEDLRTAVDVKAFFDGNDLLWKWDRSHHIRFSYSSWRWLTFGFLSVFVLYVILVGRHFVLLSCFSSLNLTKIGWPEKYILDALSRLTPSDRLDMIWITWLGKICRRNWNRHVNPLHFGLLLAISRWSN